MILHETQNFHLLAIPTSLDKNLSAPSICSPPIHMAEISEPSITIKLLIDRQRERVVLAEVGKDFVDILFNFLTFPIGTIVRLLREPEPSKPQVTIGCFNNLYNSVEDIGEECFRTEACKHMLLYPRNVDENKCRKLKFNLDDTEMTKCFMCPDACKQDSRLLVSYHKTARCHCRKLMNREVPILEEQNGEELDEGGSMFFVTDNLCVAQNTAAFLIQYLGSQRIKCISQLEETVLDIDLVHVSCILRNLLTSNLALTDTFLKKQRSFGSTAIKQPLRFTMRATEEKPGIAPNIRLTLKIMFRKSSGEILCAEADRGFVDLLFTFVTLPLKVVLENLKGGNLQMLSCIHYLLMSERELNWESSINRGVDVLPPHYSSHNLLSNIRPQVPPVLVCSRKKKLSGSSFYIRHSDKSTADVTRMSKGEEQVCLVDPKSPTRESTVSQGYVEEKALFLVSDDLVVRPLVSTSTISFVKELGVPISDIEWKVISIGEQEALQLLEASVYTSSALTTGLASLIKGTKHEN